MKYLITSSLLDSFDWLTTCPPTWKKKAKEEFIAAVRREPRKTSEACQRGIDFENLVCDNCNKMTKNEFKNFVFDYYDKKGFVGEDRDVATRVTVSIADKCAGGKQQVPVMRDVEFGDKEYHLYGYADIIQPTRIIDIKTTANYKEDGYRKRSQHYLYSLCTGINTFEYLIADYEGGKSPKKVRSIEIELEENECLIELQKRIKKLVEFLEISGLWDDYVNIFTKNHKDKK